MAVTIRDVALAAGVSTATVSRALHADVRVTARTRRRVEEAAERLAYRPSAAAARLATGRHGTVAVVAPGGLPAGGGEILVGAWSVLAERGIDCALHLGERPDAVRLGLARADAALLLGRPPAFSASSQEQVPGGPVVAVGFPGPGSGVVDVDRGQVAALAAGHLRAIGFRRISVVGSTAPADSTTVRELVPALLARGLEVDSRMSALPDGPGTEGAARATAGLLADRVRPDAFLCTNDALLRGTHRSLLRHSLVPGAQVGVLGIGSEHTAEELDVSLIIEPSRELGARAARAVLSLLDDGTSAALPDLVPVSLTVRSSTRRVPVSA